MKRLTERRYRNSTDSYIFERFRLSTRCLEAAQQERVWAIVAARELGLSIRQIAVANKLSPTRIHQLLKDPEVGDIPRWLNQLQDVEESVDEALTPLQSQLASEVEGLRWCIN